MNEQNLFYLKNCKIELMHDPLYYDGRVLFFLAAEEVHIKKFPRICVAIIYPYDWNMCMTPWKYTGPGMNETGGGDRFIEEFQTDIIPCVLKKIGFINEYGVAGYSLGGLMALYMALTMEGFTFAGSVSGSLWYPGTIKFFKESILPNNVRKIYLSLGDKEKNTGNNERATVKIKTDELYDYLSNKTEVTYEINEGGHFSNVDERIEKCIKNYYI